MSTNGYRTHDGTTERMIERSMLALERIADALERYLGLIAPPKDTNRKPYRDAQGLWRIEGADTPFYSEQAAQQALQRQQDG